MTINAKGHTRSRLVKLAAGATLAGSVLGLIGADMASAAVDAPLNLTVTDAAGPSINIDWDAPTSGDSPTYYVVYIDEGGDGTCVPGDVTCTAPDVRRVVSASQTSLDGIAVIADTDYDVAVATNDEVTASSDVVSHRTPPGPAVECATAEWAPWCTVDAFIVQQYKDWADRVPGYDELVQWRAFLHPRADGADTLPPTDDVIAPDEFEFLEGLRAQYDLKAGPVTRLYIAYFLRNPEYSGYKFWLDAVNTGGWTMGQVSDFFAASAEFQAKYGNRSNGEFVALVYQNVLGRAADPAGYTFWLNQLNNGASRGWMMMQFTEAPSQEFQSKTRVAVAATEIYAEMLNRVPTLAEYDALTIALVGAPYPLWVSDAQVIYQSVYSQAAYNARIMKRCAPSVCPA